MDLQNHAETAPTTTTTTSDQITTYAGYVNTAISLGSGLFEGIRNKAKAKTAKAIADQGGYNTLTPFQKMVLARYYPNDHIPGTPGTVAPTSTTTPLSSANIKAMLPWIIGLLVLAIFGWAIMHQKK